MSTVNTGVLPAGRYLIVDLCYVLGSVWDEVHALMFDYKQDETEGVFQLKDGRRFASFGTKHGDGEYPVHCTTRGERVGGVGVDSGSVGIILVSDLDPGSDLTLGVEVDMPEPFECSKEDDGGLLVFGDYEVITDDSTDDADEKYEEDWDDDQDDDESDEG